MTKIDLIKSNWRREAFPIAAALVAFFIPIVQYGIQIPILLFVVGWFFYPKRVHKYSFWPILVFSGIYLFYIIGMFYTKNIDVGINELTQKLSLLIFPFFFGFARPFRPRHRRLVLISFVFGIIVSVIMNFATSMHSYADSKAIQDFYMSEFSLYFHPSYVAMYINFAIAILLTAVTALKFNKQQKTIAWIVILLLSLTLVFPASKMGFIVYFMVVLFFLVKWAVQKNLFKPKTALLICIAFASFLLIKYNPISSSRVGSAIQYVENENSNTEVNEIESNAARVYAWKATISEIKKHPFGVGTGDVKLVLENRFRKEGLDVLANEKLNPHNQFLQTALAVGIPAVLWFVFSLIFPFAKIIRTKDWLYALFLGIFVLNILVESMLEKQSGIIFFAFFNSFFYFMTLRPHRI